MIRVLAIVLALIAALPALAALAPGEMLDDPALEARARAIGKELRCVVCQNQSIDDSNAELAGDFRRIVRERLRLGESDAEIMRFMVDRYGDFVLLKPPVTTGTILLWAGPFAVLAIGAGIAFFSFGRSRAAALAPAALTLEEQRRLDELLADENARS